MAIPHPPAEALLTDKRRHPNANGLYLVTVTCSSCDFAFVVSFSGWSGLMCPQCNSSLQRTPYRVKKGS